MKLLLLTAAFAVSAWPQQPSFVNEGVVNAPVAEVWKVFSTSEGYKAVGVALAEVDLRIGGVIRSRYSADGVLGDEETIENVVLAYEPPRMIAIRIQKPPRTFPFKEAWKRIWTVLTLTDAGSDRTHIRVASMGFDEEAESQAMRRFFEAGNQQTIETLQKYFDTRKAAR
ncbi:MAG: SRPBCC domain-containing protein [Acidobacteriota bacterium]